MILYQTESDKTKIMRFTMKRILLYELYEIKRETCPHFAEQVSLLNYHVMAESALPD